MIILLPFVKKVNGNQLTNHFIPMTQGQDAPQGVLQLQQGQSSVKPWNRWVSGGLGKAGTLLSLCEKSGKSQANPSLWVSERSSNKRRFLEALRRKPDVSTVMGLLRLLGNKCPKTVCWKTGWATITPEYEAGIAWFWKAKQTNISPQQENSLPARKGVVCFSQLWDGQFWISVTNFWCWKHQIKLLEKWERYGRWGKIKWIGVV